MIEKIMKEYEKQEKTAVKVVKNMEYINKNEQIQEKLDEINRTNLHIERLEDEMSNTSDFIVKDEYKKQIEDAKKGLESQKEELKDLEEQKDEIIFNKRKNEKELREKICKDVNELQDKTRKELMIAKKEIDTEIARKKMELEQNKFELFQFNYEYDENGTPTNGDVFKNLQEEQIELFNEIKKLEKDSQKCENLRQKLITPYKMPAELPDDKIYEVAQRNIIKEEKTEKQENENQKENENSDIEEKINKAMEEMQKANKNYSNIHLEADDKIGKINYTQSKDTRTLGEVYGGVYSKLSKKDEKDNILNIKINEGENKIYTQYNSGKEEEYSIEEVMEEKKNLYKRLEIGKMCREITGMTGLLLARKINPEVVKALENDKETLKQYIKAIHEKIEMPFNLTHDISALSIFKKIKMLPKTMAEEKCGAIVLGKLFNKNKALVGKVVEPVKEIKDKLQDRVKVNNKDNQIEENANKKIMEEIQSETAKDVQQMMGEKQ